MITFAAQRMFDGSVYEGKLVQMKTGIRRRLTERPGFTEQPFDLCLSKWQVCNNQARKWVGLRRSTDCKDGTKCEGFDMRGTYQMGINNQGEQVLRLNGKLSWLGQKRDKDQFIGLVMGMATNNAESEWASLTWDPNGKEWNFYSSFNECDIRGKGQMEACAKGGRDF